MLARKTNSALFYFILRANGHGHAAAQR